MKLPPITLKNLARAAVGIIINRASNDPRVSELELQITQLQAELTIAREICGRLHEDRATLISLLTPEQRKEYQQNRKL